MPLTFSSIRSFGKKTIHTLNTHIPFIAFFSSRFQTVRFRYLLESDESNGPFINPTQLSLVHLYEVILSHVNISRRIYDSCSMITLYISETTNILMDTVSYNFLWSYCESLFHYGFDLDHTCYPSQLLLKFFYCKALIVLEILCLSKSCIPIGREFEEHLPKYSFPYSSLEPSPIHSRCLPTSIIHSCMNR